MKLQELSRNRRFGAREAYPLKSEGEREEGDLVWGIWDNLNCYLLRQRKSP